MLCLTGSKYQKTTESSYYHFHQIKAKTSHYSGKRKLSSFRYRPSSHRVCRRSVHRGVAASSCLPRRAATLFLCLDTLPWHTFGHKIKEWQKCHILSSTRCNWLTFTDEMIMQLPSWCCRDQRIELKKSTCCYRALFPNLEGPPAYGGVWDR